jgi:leucyl/phenylalanyl-tRNA--protein transferase
MTVHEGRLDPWRGVRLGPGLGVPVAIGGELTPDAIVGAHQRGIFCQARSDEQQIAESESLYAPDVAAGDIPVLPSPGNPYRLLWWSPPVRYVITRDALRLGRSARRSIRMSDWATTLDRDFDGVMAGCRGTREPRWMTDDLIAALRVLVGLGRVHTAEVWRGSELVGGAFAMTVGHVLIMESAFRREPDAAKVAIADLIVRASAAGYRVFDTEVRSDYTVRMGAVPLPRAEYLGYLGREVTLSPIPAERREAAYLLGAVKELPMSTAVRTSIVTVDELPDALDHDWIACSTALAPRVMRAAAADSRWRVSYAVAVAGSRTAGIIGLYQKIGTTFPAGVLDPSVVAPEVFPSPLSADRYLLIGGSTDLVSGSVISPAISGEAATAVRRALVDAGFGWAAEGNLTGAALYVRDSELPAYESASAARPRQQVGENATLTIPPGGWDGYVRSLGRKVRATVTRETGDFAALGLVSREVDPADLIEEAAPLIVAVRGRHGLADHELLVQYRLSEWIASCPGEPVAFTVSDRAGKLLGACFGCSRGDMVELIEIGMVDEHAARHLVYAEIVIYAPVRFAIRRGQVVIELGLESTYPKGLRGAAISPVWAVGAGSPGAPSYPDRPCHD